MAELKLVSKGNKTYVGNVDKTDDKTIIQNAMEIRGSEITEEDIKKYLKTKNLGELVEIELTGEGTLMVRGLTKREETQFNMYSGVFELVKSNAQARMENDYFDKELKQ